MTKRVGETDEQYKVRRSIERKTASAAKKTTGQATASDESEGASFVVEDAPIETFEKQSLTDRVLSQLGLKASAQPTPAPAKASSSGNLNKKQQIFCDQVNPLAASAFMLAASWAWSKVAGPEFDVLAPSEEVATKIVAPLIRIYARTSPMLESISPNKADVLACLSALVAYGMTSMNMYQMIRREQEEEETDGNDAGQNRSNSAGTRRAGVSRASNEYAESNIGHDGDSIGINSTHLTGRDREAYEKLSRLSELDAAGRARRNGQFGTVQPAPSE